MKAPRSRILEVVSLWSWLLGACGGRGAVEAAPGIPPPPPGSWAAELGEPPPPSSAAPRLLHELEGITELELDNGLRVLLLPDPSQGRITVNVTYLVGSRHEGYGESGMAHLLEHMLFKGTPEHPDPWQELDDHGADFNGTTWYDRTNYYETMPASDENLAWALRFEASRMLDSTIDAEDLAREFTVVRNEFEMDESQPSIVLDERVLSTAYLWHNYGKSTIGARSDIERVPVDRLRDFYRRYYRPDNAVLVIAGDFEPARALALAQESFGRAGGRHADEGQPPPRSPGAARRARSAAGGAVGGRGRERGLGRDHHRARQRARGGGPARRAAARAGLPRGGARDPAARADRPVAIDAQRSRGPRPARARAAARALAGRRSPGPPHPRRGHRSSAKGAALRSRAAASRAVGLRRSPARGGG
ncbi:MAG: insulinase family protein [Myxococcales bacterium]|nr:insulinase family protein [Myxococcales bacterium]